MSVLYEGTKIILYTIGEYYMKLSFRFFIAVLEGLAFGLKVYFIHPLCMVGYCVFLYIQNTVVCMHAHPNSTCKCSS